MNLRLLILGSVAAISLSGCSTEPEQETKTVNEDAIVYTFYRNSVLDPSMRVHVATFDSKEGGAMNPDYNRASCEETAGIYRKLDTDNKNWWCEKGRYRP